MTLYDTDIHTRDMVSLYDTDSHATGMISLYDTDSHATGMISLYDTDSHARGMIYNIYPYISPFSCSNQNISSSTIWFAIIKYC